jgi:MFS transporter, OFA family, oxalate/formate antiporter
MSVTTMRKGLVILIAGTGINLTLGVLYSWSVIQKALVADLGWTHSAAATPYTVAIVVFASALLAAGWLQDSFGPKPIITLGTVLTATGFILGGLFQSPAMMILSFGVIVGSGLGFGYACITPAVMKWFHPGKKGVVTGIVVSGFGVASIYIAPLTTWLIHATGLSTTFLCIGGFFLLVSTPMARIIDDPPAGFTPAVPRVASGKQASGTVVTEDRDFPWRDMIRTTAFFRLWIMFAFSSSAGLMIIGNLASIAKEQAGFEKGFYLVGLLALFNAGGRIFGGMVSDRFGRVSTMRIVFALQGANMLLFPFYIHPIGIATGAAVAGLSYGALFSLFPAAAADYYGLKNLGTNYGVLFTAWGLSGALGPIIAAWAIDTTGSYLPAYRISAGLLVVALVLTIRISSAAEVYRRRQTDKVCTESASPRLQEAEQ